MWRRARSDRRLGGPFARVDRHAGHHGLLATQGGVERLGADEGRADDDGDDVVVVGHLLAALLAFPAVAAEKSSRAFDADDFPRPSSTPTCGTIVTPEQAQADLEKLEQQGTGTSLALTPPYYVPIAPHIVRESAGTLGVG